MTIQTKDGRAVIRYKTIKMSPLKHAIGVYKFICADLEEGINYSVSTSLIQDSMKAIGVNIIAREGTSAREFVDMFYKAYCDYVGKWRRLYRPR